MITYKISPVYWMVCDSNNNQYQYNERVDFHAEKGDYFSTLSAVLSFIEEVLIEKNVSNELDKEVGLIKNMRKDLKYLNANYDIRRKNGR